jgi:lipopolysaccharide/colanic/teichoic acid biosynthesis glycosyltransferase
VIALEAKEFKVAPPQDGFHALGLRPDSPWSRIWQVLVAVLGLLILLPVSLAVAVATKLTSRGPVLYRGMRIGRNMEPFHIVKFRTLLVDAEQKIGARLLTPGDPLYTPVGRFLKRAKLDEIPQLWNVVRGDMSLVGPRPLPLGSDVFVGDERRRLRVKPGITGLSQINGRSDLSWERTVALDMHYVDHWSLLLDNAILLKTPVTVLRGRGAY